jgi:hypothetical protein
LVIVLVSICRTRATPRTPRRRPPDPRTAPRRPPIPEHLHALTSGQGMVIKQASADPEPPRPNHTSAPHAPIVGGTLIPWRPSQDVATRITSPPDPTFPATPRPTSNPSRAICTQQDFSLLDPVACLGIPWTAEKTDSTVAVPGAGGGSRPGASQDPGASRAADDRSNSSVGPVSWHHRQRWSGRVRPR